MGVCCLLALELLYEVVDLFLCRFLVLIVLVSNICKGIVVTIVRILFIVCINVLLKHFLVHNNVVKIHFRDLNVHRIRIPRTIFHQILEIFVESTLSCCSITTSRTTSCCIFFYLLTFVTVSLLHRLCAIGAWSVTVLLQFFRIYLFWSALSSARVGIYRCIYVLFLLGMSIDLPTDSDNIIKSLTVLNFLDHHTLFITERHGGEGTNLAVKIDTVNERDVIQFFIIDREEVLVVKFLVSFEESLGQPRILSLHQLLDTRIFDHVDVIFGDLCDL